MAEPRIFAEVDKAYADIGLKPEHIESWTPSMAFPASTVVRTVSGLRHVLHIPFNEFHAWVIGPAAAADKERAEKRAGVTTTKRKGK